LFHTDAARFTVDDRGFQDLLYGFDNSHRLIAALLGYVPFVHTLFWTGARPSELLGLRWGDIDLKAALMSISKSRYMDQDGATKTAGAIGRSDYWLPWSTF
jgi:integrase